MKLAPCQQVYAYWNTLRGARSAPERRDINPEAIRGALSDTFILDLSPDLGLPFRVVGSRINAMFDRELRLEPFTRLWRDADVGEITRIVRGVADGAQPFVIGARGAPEGLTPIDLEVLLLPIRYHGATHARLLGVCALSQVTGWLGLLPMQPFELTSFRALREPPFAPPPARRMGATKILRRGHLFVYVSGS